MAERNTGVAASLAPWLEIADGARALTFYTAAFGTQVVYRHDSPGGDFVVRLSVDGAEFWVSADDGAASAEAAGTRALLGGGRVRLILTVADPDALFERAITAGATEVYPVSEGHGWRIGRLVDPFGLHWEIGRPLA